MSLEASIIPPAIYVVGILGVYIVPGFFGTDLQKEIGPDAALVALLWPIVLPLLVFYKAFTYLQKLNAFLAQRAENSKLEKRVNKRLEDARLEIQNKNRVRITNDQHLIEAEREVEEILKNKSV